MLNASPCTSVRYKVSKSVLIVVTTNLNPVPLKTLTFELSIVNTSPTLNPELPAWTLTELIVSSAFTVKLPVAFTPPPLKLISGILFCDAPNL